MKSEQIKYFDVIIAGEGPSGTSCALALREAGLSVALIDKANFPRDKVCGDAIPNLALEVMREINIEYKEYFYSTRYISSKGTNTCLRWKSIAYNSPGKSFDSFFCSSTGILYRH